VELKKEELDIPEFLQELVESDITYLNLCIEHYMKLKDKALDVLIRGNIEGRSYEDAQLRINFARRKYHLYLVIVSIYEEIKKERFGAHMQQH
jgi:hypothetical protein